MPETSNNTLVQSSTERSAAPSRTANASKLKLDSKKDTKPKEPENLTHTLVTIAPDGGWAWVILAVSTWDCLCIDGVSLGYSVIQEDVIQLLGITGVQSSMMVSIFNCLVYMLGPITAAVANRFGFKIMNILGGAVGTAALAACYVSNTYIMTLMLYGVLSGVGGAMIYMVSMACPGYWFENKRSLAFGVSNSASGVACLIIPPLAKAVDKALNWKSVFFLLAIMFLLAFLFGFLIRKPPMMLVEVEGYEPPEQTKPAKAAATMSMSIINVRSTGGTRRADDVIRQMSTHRGIQNQKPNPRQLSDPSIVLTKPSLCQKCFKKCKSDNEVTIERPMYKSDIFLAGKTSAVKKPRANQDEADYMLSVHKMTTERDIRQQLEHQCICCPEAMIRPLKDMLSLSLLKNPVYLVFLVDTMFYYSAIYVTYLYVPRTAKRKGLGEDVGILTLQLFGGFVALTRISLGVIFHFFPDLPPHYFTSGYVILGGICHCGLSWTTNKIAVCVLGCVMGFLIGVYVPMRSVLVVRYIGLDKLTNAMGMLFVFQAVGSLYGAPVAEAVRDMFDDDYMTYYFAGIMYSMTGLLVLPLEILNNRIIKAEKKKLEGGKA
ncbi:hypothetical protein GE061_005180 [Apolygus lucorum]|uniref:Major facilitator superfamily (MFS) profile domain-containing protein n=1 Tax=Apolygus lucorum TaxID=248454 RepID=A0A6A4IX34_APOLU|nr:hypothetical protein GE061_005180 [Apolygus lucorum]